MANYKVVDADELDAKLSAIGDSVRAKTGKTELIPIDDIPAEIDGISAGGAVDDRFAKWIEGDMAVLYDPIATSVCENFASTGNSSSSYPNPATNTLTSVDLPNAITIGEKAFYACPILSSINLPKVETIEANAFIRCSGITSVNLPNVKTIGDSGFSNCQKNLKIDIPNIETIGKTAFSGNTVLGGDLYFPNLKSLGAGAFRNTAIKSFSAPNYSGNLSAFAYCTELEWVSVPKARQINNDTSGSPTAHCFADCVSLKRVSAPRAYLGTGGSWSFGGCTNLKVVELLKISSASSYSKLPTENIYIRVIAFRDSNRIPLYSVPTTGVFAVGGEGGYIIVPSSLIDSYKIATNWSALYAAGTCTFLPLEEYTVDGTLDGELDWEKVEALIPEDESGGTEE